MPPPAGPASHRGEAHADPALRVLELLRRFRFFTERQLTLATGCRAALLAGLEKDGFLAGFGLAVPFTDKEPERVYALAKEGAHALMLRLGLDRSAVPYLTPSKRPKALLSIEHTLLRNEVALSIARSCNRLGDAELLQWEHRPDRIGDAAFLYDERRGAERVPIVADGFALVRVGEDVVGLFVEADRGTVGLPRMTLKYRGYASWWRSGGPQRRFGIKALRVLTVAVGDKRTERLRAAARAAIHGGTGTRLLWFAPAEAVRVDGPNVLTGPLWMLAHSRNGNRYPLIAG